MLIARSDIGSTSRATGSLSTKAPTGIVMEVSVPKLNARSDAASIWAPSLLEAM
jgi:hypothetical protein